MKKTIFLFFVLAAALSMTSCRKAVEKARRNIRIEAVEKVERHGLSGFDLVLRVMNNTGYKLVLHSAEVDVFYGESRVGRITLRESAEAPKHATTSVCTQWQLRISDPLALYMLAKKLDRGDAADVYVSYAAEGRGGPAPVNISQEKVPLSVFLNNFGLSVQDLGKYLGE